MKPFYCVIRLHDLRIMYLGDDPLQAMRAKLQGTHSVTASRLGDAMSRAAYEAGFLRRGLKPPPHWIGDAEH